MKIIRAIIKSTEKPLIIGLMLWATVHYTFSAQAEEKIRIAFINPDKKGNVFWDDVTNFMKAVASDLGIQLQVYYSDKDRFKSLKVVKELIEDKQTDYLVYIYQIDTGREILETTERAKLKSFIINTDITARSIGLPRKKYRHWLGHMSPDDVRAGYDLADKLIKQARIKKLYAKDKKIHLIGLAGSRDSSASLDRIKGLQQAVKDNPDVKLHQNAFTNWDSEVAAIQTKSLFQRYPETTAIWSASDDIAIGAIKSLKSLNKTAGKDFIIGGMDWTTAGIDNVDAGKMVASIGGHFMEGGWALVLLYDYHHGTDFISFGTSTHSRMSAVTKNNVHYYRNKTKLTDWGHIDFRKYSKALNPKLQRYNFILIR